MRQGAAKCNFFPKMEYVNKECRITMEILIDACEVFCYGR